MNQIKIGRFIAECRKKQGYLQKDIAAKLKITTEMLRNYLIEIGWIYPIKSVILKNNAPKYLVIDFSKADESALAKDEDVIEISKRLLEQNKEAYEVLAK